MIHFQKTAVKAVFSCPLLHSRSRFRRAEQYFLATTLIFIHNTFKKRFIKIFSFI